MTSYCPFCGKVARWPKTAPEACSMRCAADTAIGYVEVGGDWDAAPCCTGCGDEVTPGQGCWNQHCPRCSAEPEED